MDLATTKFKHGLQTLAVKLLHVTALKELTNSREHKGHGKIMSFRKKDSIRTCTLLTMNLGTDSAMRLHQTETNAMQRSKHARGLAFHAIKISCSLQMLGIS